MNLLDQKISAWGGPLCAVTVGSGLTLAGFVPPPRHRLKEGQGLRSLDPAGLPISDRRA